jgi:hypothetical protein
MWSSVFFKRKNQHKHIFEILSSCATVDRGVTHILTQCACGAFKTDTINGIWCPEEIDLLKERISNHRIVAFSVPETEDYTYILWQRIDGTYGVCSLSGRWSSKDVELLKQKPHAFPWWMDKYD